jgi:hypothetical protein
VPESPIERLLGAVDRLDLEAAMALMAPQGRMLAVDGRRAEGVDEVRELIADFLAHLRSTTHTITAQWHQDDVWIAEVDATYELTDWLLTGSLPRAVILRAGPDGVTDVRVYGAHEPDLADEDPDPGAIHIGGRWMPSL